MAICFFEIEGAHPMNANWFIQTMIGINQKACKAIKFFKSWKTHPFKKKTKKYYKTYITWNPIFFKNKNVHFENFKNMATWWYVFKN